ncbi:N-acetylglucosamine 6-O-sulfotransferase [Desmophyllum pertusum]|uniref:N-acetylglucosamine 6-O-sulfotransferase n=1 Tax=Desmophyllum pertusum TaxID=174260 RepID=A0A9X0D435_9CNID|nr:N-acetylglucosamine 6-O-sulfotransferase [Desmophyllum pertusum]
MLSKFLVSEATSSQTVQSRQRKSLLIIGRGRSGTSFVSKMFASGEQTLEVYEPLRYHNLTNDEKFQVLRAFLSCRFTPSTLWEKDYFPPFWYLRETSYFVEPSKKPGLLKIPEENNALFSRRQTGSKIY